MITIEDKNKVLKYLVSKDKQFLEVEFDYLYDQQGVRFHHADMILDQMQRMGILGKETAIGCCHVRIYAELFDFYNHGGFKE